MDKRSQMACLNSCRQLLKQGASVLFFPEGTRATDMVLKDFKKVLLYLLPECISCSRLSIVNCMQEYENAPSRLSEQSMP